MANWFAALFTPRSTGFATLSPLILSLSFSALAFSQIDQYLPNFSHKLEAFAAGAKDLAVNSYDKSATLIKEKVLV